MANYDKGTDGAPEDKVARCTASGNAAAAAVASQKKQRATALSALDASVHSREVLELEHIISQAKIDLLDELSCMSVEDKLFTLFDCLDKDGNGKVAVHEVEDGLRKIEGEVTFTERIRRATKALSTVDVDKDGKITCMEFQKFLNILLPEADCTLDEIVELMAIHVLFDSANFADMSVDDRMILLFLLFDTDGNGTLDFKEVAVGLSKMTTDMDESTKTAWSTLLMYAEENERSLTYPEFARLIVNVAAAANIGFDHIADGLTCAICRRTDKNATLACLFMGDDLAKATKEFEDVDKIDAEGMDVVQYGRMNRLFDLWDLDHNGYIDVSELVLGIRKFQDAKNLAMTVEESISAMLAFDENKDGKLDRAEFAAFLNRFAKSSKIKVDELIDFMVVQSALKDNDEAELAYVETIGKKATEQLTRRGNPSKRWFGIAS